MKASGKQYIAFLTNAVDISPPLRVCYIMTLEDRLCGLVVRIPGFRSRGPGSNPAATTFSEKYWVWNGVHSAS
jgi:hypothetical protein